MRAETLRFRNLRNHHETEITGFSERINVLVGPNGAGKTSVLESLSLATLTKSFSTASDQVLFRAGESELQVDASLRSDVDVPHHVKVNIQLGPPLRKSLSANNERMRSAADLIGRAPVVVLTPDEKVITSGPPSERRRFLNLVLSQASRSYLEDELEYKRALKQRNAILNDARIQKRSLSYVRPLLEPWSEMLIARGVRIMRRRASFVEEFKPYLFEAYQLVSSNRELPGLEYLPIGMDSISPDHEQLLRTQLAAVEMDELRRGSSLAGPHRDDIRLNINPDREAKYYASQGQHKTLLVSMKLAEFRYLKAATSETPILLLDDVFSELDKDRARQLLDLAENGGFGQTFITSTDRDVFEATVDFKSGFHRLYLVDGGSVSPAYSN